MIGVRLKDTRRPRSDGSEVWKIELCQTNPFDHWRRQKDGRNESILRFCMELAKDLWWMSSARVPKTARGARALPFSKCIVPAAHDVFCKSLGINLPDEDEDDEGEGEFRKAGVFSALMNMPAFLGPQDDRREFATNSNTS